MQNYILHYLSVHWPSVLIPLAVFVATLGFAILVKKYVLRAMSRWAERTSSDLDDLVVTAVRTVFVLWAIIAALAAALYTSSLPDRILRAGGKLLLLLWVVSLTLAAARLAGGLVRHYGARAQGGVPATTLAQNVARIVVACIGILMLLNELGVSITPILTALGVGGLAVALALQDTLANLFAGFYVSLSGQIRPGDYVKLESGEEGYVTDIGWRSVTIRALPNNLIIVPSGKLAQAIVTNYYLPEKRMSLLIPVGVSYDADPEQVERILIEEAKAGARDIPGLLAEPAPFVRFIPGFGDFSLDFTLICQVAEFTDQYLAQHELRKRIFRRFRREGIEIPFPIRTLYVRGEDAGKRLEEVT
jgi:small-conductance mechanosensitive channel